MIVTSALPLRAFFQNGELRLLEKQVSSLSAHLGFRVDDDDVGGRAFGERAGAEPEDPCRSCCKPHEHSQQAAESRRATGRARAEAPSEGR